MTSPEIDNQILGDLTWKGYKDITISGFERGVAIERERIIKLLEDNNTCDGGISTGTCFCEAIDFLKGEK
jgi:hypothetical protein